MRCAMTRVFPLPAPATTSTGPLVETTASRWGGLRKRRMLSAVTSEAGMGSYDSTAANAPTAGALSFCRAAGARLLHRDRLRQIAWLIDVTPEAHRDVIGQQ